MKGKEGWGRRGERQKMGFAAAVRLLLGFFLQFTTSYFG